MPLNPQHPAPPKSNQPVNSAKEAMPLFRKDAICTDFWPLTRAAIFSTRDVQCLVFAHWLSPRCPHCAPFRTAVHAKKAMRFWRFTAQANPDEVHVSSESPSYSRCPLDVRGSWRRHSALTRSRISPGRRLAGQDGAVAARLSLRRCCSRCHQSFPCLRQPCDAFSSGLRLPLSEPPVSRPLRETNPPAPQSEQTSAREASDPHRT